MLIYVYICVFGALPAIKGQGLCCYITLIADTVESEALLREFKMQVRQHIGMSHIFIYVWIILFSCLLCLCDCELHCVSDLTRLTRF